MEVIYQVRGRRMYVRGFQLIRGIQHAILQICVCVRRGYANESVCEERVKLGECVRGVFVRIGYCTDVFFVVDVWSCVCYELFPRWTYIGINPYEWTRYSSFLKTHERKHVYRWWESGFSGKLSSLTVALAFVHQRYVGAIAAASGTVGRLMVWTELRGL